MLSDGADGSAARHISDRYDARVVDNLRNAAAQAAQFATPFDDWKGLTELELAYDRTYGALWLYACPSGRPSSTPQLLHDMVAVFDQIEEAHTSGATRAAPLKWLITASGVPGILHLGGDLKRIVEIVRDCDRDSLMDYARLCIDVVYARLAKRNMPYISITLAQGDTLGGGFEAVLADDVIIAEKQARFGMPEALFNMFPGMGALSFLTRRVGQRLAEEIVFSGSIYSAAQMHEMGVVDILVEDGTGEDAVDEFIRSIGRSYNSRRSVYAARGLTNPVTYEELLGITTMWVDTAMALDAKDLRRMERLVAAQDRRLAQM